MMHAYIQRASSRRPGGPEPSQFSLGFRLTEGTVLEEYSETHLSNKILFISHVIFLLSDLERGTEPYPVAHISLSFLV